MAQENQSGPPSEYTDRPEISETFVDEVEDCGVFWDDFEDDIVRDSLSAAKKRGTADR